jgi:DNA-binding transcriptional LysR family regulator
MTPSTVSKLIGRMEDRLGVRLVERSTRRLSLTDEGRLFYERSGALLTDLDDIEREVSSGAAAPAVRCGSMLPWPSACWG